MSNMEARSFLEAVAGYSNSAPGGLQQSSADRPVRLATIDYYYTSGLPTVHFDGEVNKTVKGYTWVKGYFPKAMDRVYMIPVGQTYIIGGKIESIMEYNQWLDVPMSNGWQAFDATAYPTLRVTKTPTGLVKLSGMIKGGTATPGTIIGNLQPPFRPTSNISFMILSNGQAGGIDINTNGEIKAGSGIISGGSYNALDNITFNADPYLAWQSPTAYSNGFSEYSPQLAIGYAKDSLGRVWFRGAAKNAVTPTGDTPMFNIPAGYRSYRQQHFVSYTASGFGNLDASENGNISYKTNGGNAAYIYLNNVMYNEVSVGGWTNMSLINGWTNNAIGQPDASYYKDSEGIVHLRGLIRGGSIGAACFVLPQGMRPSKILLRGTVSANAIGRLDIEPNGSLVPVSGVNTWYSLDGIQFSAEQ